MTCAYDTDKNIKFFISSKGVVLEGKQLRKVVEMKTATGRFFFISDNFCCSGCVNIMGVDPQVGYIVQITEI